MNILTLLFVILVLGSLVAFPFFRRSKPAAFCFGISCLLAAAFFVFGFLASFEPGVSGSNLPWRILYATLFLLALGGVIKAATVLFSRA